MRAEAARGGSVARALLCCARTLLTPRERSQLASLSRDGLDGHALAALAEAHGVTPLLARHLDALGDACTPELRVQISTAAKLGAARSLGQAAELVTVLDLLQRAGVSALAIKGPASALLCYGDLGLRTFSDLDVLVRPEEAARALDALAARGYLPQPPLSEAVRARLLEVDSELLLRQRDDERLVDVHWALLPRGYSFSPDGRGPFSARGEVQIAGSAVPTLGVEATLLFLLLHGMKHDWASLGWLCDVAELTRRQSIDWDAVLMWSSGRGRRRFIDVGLALAQRVLDAEVPERVLQRGRSDARVAGAVLELEQRMFQPQATAPSIREQSLGLAYFRNMERLRDRARFLHDVVLRPTTHEWRALPLPRALDPLYYALRPLRLGVKHAGAALRRRAR